MEYGTARVRTVPESGVDPRSGGAAMPFRAAHASTGPLGFHLGELEWYGLGVIVRFLRIPGAAMQEPLRRLYCLCCGRAVAHEPLIPEWWICAQGCNGTTGLGPSEEEFTGETA
jgi:hypothetical protein